MPAAPLPMKLPLSGLPAGRFRAVRILAAWVLGCALAAWLADICLPPAELPPVVREKLTHLAAHGDEYDAIFIGSSRVQFHIIPAVFDSYAGGHGLALKSFNAGVVAMLPPEDGYMLDQILRRPHRRLRWVFIELSPFNSGQDPHLTGTERIGYWLDWERLVLLSKRAINQFRKVRFSKAQRRRTPWADRMAAYAKPITQGLDTVRLFAVKSVSLGRGATLAARLVTPATRDAAGDSLGRYGDGWSYLGDDHQRMSGEELASYEQAYAERLETPSRKDFHDELGQEALELLLAKVARAGARTILFVAPTPDTRHYFPPPAREQALTIFDFSDVREYPELFKTENRQDIEHLNAAGAEVFSRILAQRFVEHVRSGP